MPTSIFQEIVFSIGATLIGGLSLGAGFIRAEVPLIVLRVLTGIGCLLPFPWFWIDADWLPLGAALTVPSALHLIVHMFPDTGSQAKAIAAFGASAVFGNGAYGLGIVFNAGYGMNLTLPFRPSAGFWIEYSSLTARN
jgi:hypothetical protein